MQGLLPRFYEPLPCELVGARRGSDTNYQLISNTAGRSASKTRQIRPHDDGKSEQGAVRSVFGDIQRKENTEDQYSAALRGETLPGPPDACVRAGAATSMPAASSHPENIAVSLQTGPGAEESKVAATTTSFTIT